MEDFDGHSKYAKYSVFSVGDEGSEFELTVKSYSGDAGMIFYYHCLKSYWVPRNPMTSLLSIYNMQYSVNVQVPFVDFVGHLKKFLL
jgi:hypothetical protein